MTPHEPSVRPERGPAPAAREPDRAVIVIGGPVDPGVLAVLCADVERLLAAGDVQVVVCDVQPYPAADLRLVEALARLALSAKRHGRRVRVRHASWKVRRLLALAGLDDVLPCEGAASVEVRR